VDAVYCDKSHSAHSKILTGLLLQDVKMVCPVCGRICALVSLKLLQHELCALYIISFKLPPHSYFYRNSNNDLTLFFAVLSL
jgi:hypothetical protein